MVELISSLLMLTGGLTALLAGIGLLRFSSAYARFHAAGKASPVAFAIAALGSALVLDWPGVLLLMTATAAMVLTLPVGVHLLFRAFYRTSANRTLNVDELTAARTHGR
ncbi:MAG: monovalent cation/H(+) antiporter subunit G [Acidimicrobiia bacterium]|nr:monovalent cation/H(+) antiporter subunit G [Acidimicrobiia bacterium]